MNYYEILEPYYALIKAKDDVEAVNFYIETVAGYEEEFDTIHENCNPVPEYYAAARFSRATGVEDKLIDFEEIIDVLESGRNEVLLMDGALI